MFKKAIFLAAATVAVGALSSAASAATIADQLIGSWATQFAGDGSGVTTSRYQLTFNADGTCDMTVDAVVNLALGHMNMRQEMPCHYHVGSASTVVPGAYDIDYTMTSLKMTMFDQPTVDDQNSQKYCGISDWQAGVARDVTGLDCDDSTFEAGGLDADLVSFDAAGLLHVGLEPSDLIAPRPTSLDPCIVYYRQGHVPPGGGGAGCDKKANDPLPNIYQVTSHLENTSDCTQPPTPAGGQGFVNLYTNDSILAGALGWEVAFCNSVSDCQGITKTLLFDTPWPLNEQATDSTWTGYVNETVWTGACQVTNTQVTVERQSDGSLRLEHRRYKGVMPAIADKDHCSTENMRVDPVALGFACVGLGELNLKPAAPLAPAGS